jgi:acyl-CoA hydrolase
VETFKLVRPEHLNHYGYLFGGFLLMWVDEIGWIAASRDYPGRRVRLGAVLRLEATQSRKGTTSVQYQVSVFADDLESGAEERVFSTHISFVCLDDQGQKLAVPEC